MLDEIEPAPPRMIIRNAGWLVAWDEVARSHIYRRNVDLVIEGDTIVSIASIGSVGPADDRDAVEMDGRGFVILPGFVDIHAHPSSEPMLKGLTDEVGSRQLYMSSLYEYLPLFEADAEGRRAAIEVALCELMQSGVTTVCDLSAARDDWLDTLGASWMRVYAAPMFRSGRRYTPNGHEVRYEWDEQAGWDGLDRALRLIDRARQHLSGRLDGVLYPAQVDTSRRAGAKAISYLATGSWPTSMWFGANSLSTAAGCCECLKTVAPTRSRTARRFACWLDPPNAATRLH